MKQAKNLIRKEIKKNILSMSSKQLQIESQMVADMVRKLPQYQSAKVWLYLYDH